MSHLIDGDFYLYMLSYKKRGEKMTLDELIKEIEEYNAEEIPKVKKAYEVASIAHQNQFRASGEPYIIHPLNVCMNLARLHADGSSLCAGLLHDVVEDTDCTLEDIEKDFGPDVAKLVDGVTKLSNIHYNTKDEAANANIRRLINSLNDDVRIIIIKLCDRLHNMQTLGFKEPKKQIRSAEETLNIFVPIAYYLGCYRLKCELEDICLSYLKPKVYESLKNKQTTIENDYRLSYETAEKEIIEILKEHNIKFTYRIKILSIYQLYQKVNKGYKMNDIHDLVNFKIMVKSLDDCYRVLGLIHQLYTPLNNKFKDYIACPKTNMYRSLHTTVFAPDNHIIQFQIKTEEMDKINTFGLAGYWYLYKGHGKIKMQEELILNYQFFNSLQDLNKSKMTDRSFINHVKKEIFTNTIYVYTITGEIIELPYGSTVIDFAYKIHTEIGNHLKKAFINGKEVDITYQLNNKDRIFVVSDDNCHPNKNWLNYANTTHAKRAIRDNLK